MKRNLKQTLEIAETSLDPRIKLEARRIANDCYKYIMDMVSNGTIKALINECTKIKIDLSTNCAIKVNGRMDHLNAAEKKVLQDIKDKDK